MTENNQGHFEEAKRLRNSKQISPYGRNDKKMLNQVQHDGNKAFKTSSGSTSGPVGEGGVKKELLFDRREFNSFSFRATTGEQENED